MCTCLDLLWFIAFAVGWLTLMSAASVVRIFMMFLARTELALAVLENLSETTENCS